MKLTVLKEQQSEMKEDLLISLPPTLLGVGIFYFQKNILAYQFSGNEWQEVGEMKEDVCEKECKGRCTHFRRHY